MNPATHWYDRILPTSFAEGVAALMFFAVLAVIAVLAVQEKPVGEELWTSLGGVSLVILGAAGRGRA